MYISGIIREKGSASISVLSNIAKELEVPLASLFDDYQSVCTSNSELTCPKCGASLELKIKE